jgi:hypothetical protein
VGLRGPNCHCHQYVSRPESVNLLTQLVTMYFAGKVAAKIAPRQKEWVKAIQRRVGMTASMLAVCINKSRYFRYYD